MILLDTNIVIAFFNGNKSVLREMHERIDSIALSVLVIAELDYGAKASQRARKNLDKLYRLIDIVQIVPFDIECAKAFGSIKTKIQSRCPLRPLPAPLCPVEFGVSRAIQPG